MKYTVTCLISLFLVGVSSHPIHDIISNPLFHDFIDFYNVLPREDIVEVVLKHNQDPKLLEALNYINSTEFQNLLYSIEKLPAFNDYVLGLEDAGYPIIAEIQLLHINLNLKPYVSPKGSKQRVARDVGEGGMIGLAKDIIAVLPKNLLRALHEKKLKDSPAFAKYAEYIRSEKYAELRKSLLAQKPVVEFLEKSSAHGFDWAAVEDLKLYFLGFK